MTASIIKYKIAGAGRNGLDLVTSNKDKAKKANLEESRPVATAVFDSYAQGGRLQRAEYQTTKWQPATWHEREQVRYYLIRSAGWQFTFSAAAARRAYNLGQLVITVDAEVARHCKILKEKRRRDQKQTVGYVFRKTA